jgi:hypothetical protein
MSDPRTLIQEASERVKAVRADPAAEWPAGSLEAADTWLDVALAGMLGPGPTPPPATTITGVAVTYSGHDPARDVYAGYSEEQVAWGPHHGIPFMAPADGTVSVYTFPTPISTMMAADPVYAANHYALFGGAFICGMTAAQLVSTGQTMYFVVYQPDVPISTRYGLFKIGWAGHARGSAKVGRVKKGEWYGESYDSGIRFETAGVPNARAAHVHACASASGTLTMNGDINGLAWCEAHGWQVEFIGSNGPGPQQYQGGAFCAGRLLTDFTTHGHPIPPIPS